MKNKKRLDVLLTEQGYADTRSKAQAIIMSGAVYVDGQKADKPGTAYEDTVAKRLDVLLTEQGYADTRSKAQAIIMSGAVYVDGQKADKPGTAYEDTVAIEVRGHTCPYVSRGGLKLEKALRDFGVRPEGYVCSDSGASTGGFTDCLLQQGAKKVFAIDVGYGQLDWKIRSDERVVVMERTNIRYVTPEQLGEPLDLSVVDVSFISLKIVLPVIRQLSDERVVVMERTNIRYVTPEQLGEPLDLSVVDVSFISLKIVLPVIRQLLKQESGQVLCLIKPQFEAGKEKVGKKGVVREPQTHKEVLDQFVSLAHELGFRILGLTYSPVKGPEGNIEFLGHLVVREPQTHKEVLDQFVSLAHELGFRILGLTYSPVKGPEGNIEFLGHLSLADVEGIEPDTALVVQQAHTALKG